MGTPYLSEIKIMSFSFAPRGWAMCNGQILPINQNQALFSLLGVTYGGDGRVNFALPNLQGNTPMHFGNGHTLGEKGGEQMHTLSMAELPSHTHSANTANVAPTVGNPSNARMLSQSSGANLYAGASNLKAMAPAAIANVGANQAHENKQPYLTLTFCIALTGIFPSQN
jgi:microcystin-dependent protein